MMNSMWRTILKLLGYDLIFCTTEVTRIVARVGKVTLLDYKPSNLPARIANGDSGWEIRGAVVTKSTCF